MQKRIWVETGNRLGVKPQDWNKSDLDNYLRFASAVGWYDENRRNNGRESGWLQYSYYMGMVRNDPSWGRGGLPGVGWLQLLCSEIDLLCVETIIMIGVGEGWRILPVNLFGYSFLALRLVNCDI